LNPGRKRGTFCLLFKQEAKMKRSAQHIDNMIPVSEMNTTPLIDVLLVLLIMMMLNIPANTHKSPMSLPQESTSSLSPPPHHVLGIDFEGNMVWDGKAVTRAMLATYFKTVGAMPKAVQHQVRIRPDGYARYDRVLKVLALAQQNQVENIAFLGNEAFASQ
jgi:biopolymer transport protein ExbD